MSPFPSPRRCIVAAVAFLLASMTGCTPATPAGTGSTDPQSRTGDRPSMPSAPETRYVSPTGDDGAPGTSRRPWRTINESLPRLEPGTTLVVAGGTYHERVRVQDLRPATPGERTVVRAAEGERPVVEGLFWVRDADYWTFDGINVTWGGDDSSDDHMVKLTNGIGWVWRNSEIWGAKSFANVLITGDSDGEPSDWALTDNCIHDTVPTNKVAQDSNVYVSDMIDPGPGLIARNLVFGAGNGRNIKLGGPEEESDNGPSNLVVTHNTLWQAIVPLVLTGGTHDVLVEGNVLGGSESGPAVRGYRLSGEGNKIRGNLAESRSGLMAPESGTLQAGEDNVVVLSLSLDGEGCDGFRVADPDLSQYGHLGESQPTTTEDR